MAWWNSKKDEPEINKKDVEVQINQAIEEYRVNHPSDPRGIREIFSRAISGQYDGADTLHNVFLDYGYPQNLDFFHFWNMYRRFGIAKNVVELPVDTGWLSVPEIKGGDAFDKAFEDSAKRINFWIRVKGLDNRQRVGRYAGMFMRVKDDKQPNEPLEGTLSGEQGLVSMTPLYESQLEVIETESDPKSENFGNPKMYQHRSGVAGDRNERSQQTFNIHPSRIVIAAEGADDGSILGIPILESVFNSLMDLRKIIGGGGEGFYKNASQNIVFELTDGASATKNLDALKKFNDNYDDFSRDRMRRAMWTPGLKPSVLQSDLISPKEFFGVALNDVASGAQIPATVLIGQQTGRLASDEDSKQFLSTVQSRRENYMTDLVRSLIDWMIQFGILPASEYEVIWDDLLASSDKDKLENAEKLSVINKNQVMSGGEIPFSGEDVREAAGFEPEEMPDIDGETDNDDPDDDLDSDSNGAE